MMKIICAWLLAISLVLCLCACGAKDAGKPEKPDKPDKPENSDKPEPDKPSDTPEPDPEPVPEPEPEPEPEPLDIPDLPDELAQLPGLGEEYDWGWSLKDDIVNAISWELSRVVDKYDLNRGAFPLAESYQSYLTECFYADEKRPEWTLYPGGIRFVFAPGAVAPAEAGEVEVTVDYDYYAGKLGDKYYPDERALLDAMAGEWVQVALEIEGGVSLCMPEGDRNILTIDPDGSAKLIKSSWWNGKLEPQLDLDMTLTIGEGGLWRGFPALARLEYCARQTDDYEINYTFALDDDRLVVWYEHTGEYIATVSCFCRADDANRLFPRSLGGRWIVQEVSDERGDVFPKEGDDRYTELNIWEDAYLDVVPQVFWEYAGGSMKLELELVNERYDDASAANWYLSFEDDNGTGGSYGTRLIMDGDDALRIEQWEQMAANAEPTVTTYSFRRAITIPNDEE